MKSDPKLEVEITVIVKGAEGFEPTAKMAINIPSPEGGQDIANVNEAYFYSACRAALYECGGSFKCD